MQYPKPVMRMSELKKMGFPEKWLLMAYRRHGKTIAWKMNASNNSPLLFDTDELERFRKSQCGDWR